MCEPGVNLKTLREEVEEETQSDSGNELIRDRVFVRTRNVRGEYPDV